jgi:hypothetical protein
MMMNNKKKNPLGQGADGEHPVRKLLRSLPPIQAKTGFELRLQRRLDESASTDAAFSPEEGSDFAIPQIAFSAIAILLFGLLFSFVLIVPGLTPTAPVVSEKENVSTPVEASLPPGARPSQGLSVPQNVISAGNNIVSDEKAKSVNLRTKQKSKSVPAYAAPDYSQNRSVFDSAAGNSINPDRVQSAPLETSRRALMMNQQQSVTGTLELRRGDSSADGAGKNRRLAPRVKDEFGVGVVGTAISSALHDSTKSDSLKRLKKQLLLPTTTPRKPHN